VKSWSKVQSANHDSSSSEEEDLISQDDADFTQYNFLLKIMRGGNNQLPMATTSMILNTNASNSKTHETIMAPTGASGSAIGFKEPKFSSKRCSPRFCRNLDLLIKE
jgi:hypothetical protein